MSSYIFGIRPNQALVAINDGTLPCHTMTVFHIVTEVFVGLLFQSFGELQRGRSNEVTRCRNLQRQTLGLKHVQRLSSQERLREDKKWGGW